jgi:hypothetical protein
MQFAPSLLKRLIELFASDAFFETLYNIFIDFDTTLILENNNLIFMFFLWVHIAR